MGRRRSRLQERARGCLAVRSTLDSSRKNEPLVDAPKIVSPHEPETTDNSQDWALSTKKKHYHDGPGCLSPAAAAAAALARRRRGHRRSAPSWKPTHSTSRTSPARPAASARHATPPPAARVCQLLLSVATHDLVFPVMLFDRAARTLIGCHADELARFFAAADTMRGEMCRMALREPANGKGGEHLPAVSVVPMIRDGFRPFVDALRTLYPRG
ncbi:uncharacterized protein LOC104584184 [Brachypodium distachyon]|uniref:uncharacterized protein LOC104584184 n=1 Tax=Brachypodium distachyon TaxID=15368 RepID=UPI000D0CD790|nr:uncharacterized protein LOC104584184 [Brachypodium distachyon]|eukprot:XP_010236649.3 uncharacterized protein LOC104584184 [Brachypodium distachyon]